MCKCDDINVNLNLIPSRRDIANKVRKETIEDILSFIEKRTEAWEFIGEDCAYCDRLDKLVYDLKQKFQRQN